MTRRLAAVARDRALLRLRATYYLDYQKLYAEELNHLQEGKTDGKEE